MKWSSHCRMQHTLPQVHGTGTPHQVHGRSTSAPQTAHMPVPLGYQHSWQKSASNSVFLPQPSQNGYKRSNAHPRAAMQMRANALPGLPGNGSYNVRLENEFPQLSNTYNPTLLHGAQRANTTFAVLTPSPAASGQVRSSSAPVRCGPGQGAPDMRPYAHVQPSHAQYRASQAAPAACLAPQPFTSLSKCVHGRAPGPLGFGQAFQQPSQQMHAQTMVQHCESASTGHRVVSAPATHSHVSAPCGHPSMPLGPPRQLGYTASHGIPVSEVPAGAEAYTLQSSTASLPSRLQTSTQTRNAHIRSGPTLTAEQQEVVDRTLAWDDYVLVMGLPGAGKTYTVAACVQVRPHKRKSVVRM